MAFDDLSGGRDAYIHREKEEDDGCGGEGIMLGGQRQHLLERIHFLEECSF
jgi:hypothetical protein